MTGFSPSDSAAKTLAKRKNSKRLRVEGMDILLGGGLDRGTSNLFMGPSGTGKSSLAITYAHFAAARGERVALFTFDENLDLYLAKASAFGLDLRPFIREGVLRAQQVDPAELSPGQFACLLLKFVERENVRMVIIDSLNGYSKAMQEGRILQPAAARDADLSRSTWGCHHYGPRSVWLPE